MKDKKLIFLFALVIGLIFLPDSIFATTLPSSWNQQAHSNLVTKVGELKSVLFSTPVAIAAVFAVAIGVFYMFKEGSVMPLLTVIGMVILAGLVPLILDVIAPINASAMVIP